MSISHPPANLASLDKNHHAQRSEAQPNVNSEVFGDGIHRKLSISPVSDASSKSCHSDDDPNHLDWFQNANFHPEVMMTQCKNGDSPYYINNSISTEERQSSSLDLSNHFRACKSSDDDYRSVIDDLTIENKRLKEKLRQYKKKAYSQLEKDKLFEVRIHSLTPSKRKELENALRSFASSLHSSSTGTKKPHKEETKELVEDDMSLVSAQLKSSLDSQSGTQLQSSNIGTNYKSEQQTLTTPDNSTFRENSTINNSTIPRQIESRSKGKNSSSKFQFKNLVDKQKKKLVVQRLEQLFTGKEAVADFTEREEANKLENPLLTQDELSHGQGRTIAREAHMKLMTDPDTNQTTRQSHSKEISDSSDQAFSDSSSLDQRPTGPFDLDPDRAQIPSENVQYIRHLGFETPMLTDIESTDSGAKEGSWIYLNLLVNMAQLHIINVTLDFVRSAVAEVSEKFEVSPDGQMLRWKGGSHGTLLSSDASGSSDPEAGASSVNEDSPSQILGQDKTNSRTKATNLVGVRRTKAPIEAEKTNNFHYQPIFCHRSPSESASEILNSSRSSDWDDAEESPQKFPFPGKSQKSSNSVKKDGGFLVFYSGAQFCTDLSGDPVSDFDHMEIVSQEPDVVEKPTRRVISSGGSIIRTKSGSSLPYRPFKKARQDIDYPMCEDDEMLKLDIHDETCENELFINDSSGPGTKLGADVPSLGSTGVPGVWVTDRFVLHVLTRRSMVNLKTLGGCPDTSIKTDMSHIESEILARLSASPIGPSSSLMQRRIPQWHPVQPEIMSVIMNVL